MVCSILLLLLIQLLFLRHYLVDGVVDCVEVLLVPLKFAIVYILRIQLLLKHHQVLWLIVLQIWCGVLMLAHR